MKTVVLLAVVATVLLAAAVQHEKPIQQCVVSADEREHIRQVTIQGIDKGYQDYITNLFTVWIREKAEYNPTRAVAGIERGLSAYNRAYRGIRDWNPPLC